MSKASRALDSAFEHHQAGQFQQAEELYQDVLRLSPQHPDALHLLGLLWHQQGKTAQARDLLISNYDWFTEGFDTVDLRDAKALLEALD